MEIWIKSQVVNLLNEIYNSDILEKTVSVVEGKSLLNKEYSKGGLDRNRGFYGKFMLLDILIDNMARGRKISDKQIEKGATADYIYYFDEDNMLKLVEKLPDTKYTSYEYISRKENCEIGVEINQWDSNVLNEGDLYITKTIYDNCKCQYKNAQKVENKNVHFSNYSSSDCVSKKARFSLRRYDGPFMDII